MEPNDIELDQDKMWFLRTITDKVSVTIFEVTYTELLYIQKLERRLNINIYNANMETYQAFWLQYTQGRSYMNQRNYSRVLRNYIQFAIDNGLSVNKCNYYDIAGSNRADASNYAYVYTNYFKDLNSINDYFDIIAEDIDLQRVAPTRLLYDRIISSLIFSGLSHKDVYLIPKTALNGKSISCNDITIALGDVLYNQIIDYNSDEYIYRSHCDDLLRYRKKNTHLLVSTSAKDLVYNSMYKIWRSYSKKYAEKTGRIKKLVPQCVYRSGIFSRVTQDEEGGLYDPVTKTKLNSLYKREYKTYKEAWL